MSKNNTLENLPLDILLYLHKFLPYTSIVALRSTSRPLHLALPSHPAGHVPPHLAKTFLEKYTPLYESSELACVETWPCYDTEASMLFACSLCRKLRPGTRFADNMLRRRYRKRGSRRAWRFCLDCGIREWKYAPGNCVALHGSRRVICEQCYTFAWGYERSGKYPEYNICALCKAMEDLDRIVFPFSDDECRRFGWDRAPGEWPGEELVKEWNESIEMRWFSLEWPRNL